MTHFPILGQEKPPYVKKFMEEMQLLQHEFSFHFQDAGEYETTLSVFVIPFDMSVEIPADKFHVKMIALHCMQT
jgi:hypothetical protein